MSDKVKTQYVKNALYLRILKTQYVPQTAFLLCGADLLKNTPKSKYIHISLRIESTPSILFSPPSLPTKSFSYQYWSMTFIGWVPCSAPAYNRFALSHPPSLWVDWIKWNILYISMRNSFLQIVHHALVRDGGNFSLATIPILTGLFVLHCALLLLPAWPYGWLMRVI